MNRLTRLLRFLDGDAGLFLLGMAVVAGVLLGLNWSYSHGV